MVPIHQLGRMLTGAPHRRRFLLLLTYHCDESYDSDPRQDNQTPRGGKYIPKTFVVGGFLAQERIWTKVQNRWNACNRFYGVSHFHATEVNCRDGEYRGWADSKRNSYSKRMLRILGDQGDKLCAVSCGIRSRDYAKIISETGRSKWGSPYTVAFKTCVTMIADLMGGLPPDYRFSIILARSQFQSEALEAFDIMTSLKHWKGHSRLVTCTPADPLDIIPLQPADLMAYETFRLMHSLGMKARRVRHSLNILFPQNVLLNHFWDAEHLRQIGPLRRW